MQVIYIDFSENYFCITMYKVPALSTVQSSDLQKDEQNVIMNYVRKISLKSFLVLSNLCWGGGVNYALNKTWVQSRDFWIPLQSHQSFLNFPQNS